MSSRKEEVLIEILDKIEATHANTVVVMARIEALEDEVSTNTRAVSNIGRQVGNLAVVVTDIAGQIQDIWTRMFSGFDSMGKRIRELKVIQGNGNGHHDEGREITPEDP